MSIDEIVKGCKVNDRRHQQALYVLTAEDLMRVVKRYIKDDDRAKDVFQDGYLTVFSKINQFDSNRGSIGAWTGRIFANLALAELRRNKVFADIEDLPIPLQPIEYTDVLDKLSADELLSNVNELSESYRVIFLLNIVDGYTHQEIAEQLDITASTSRSQLVRARAKLRSILKKNTIELTYGQAR